MFGAISYGGGSPMVDQAAGAEIRPARSKGLFGKKVSLLSALNGDDGRTLAHKGMPAVLQRNERDEPQGMPGPISGFGGGTFNMDGSQATPVDHVQDMQPQSPLGGSMRQPFDYSAAAKALAGDRKDPKAWQYALAAVGDALIQNSGGSPYAMRYLVGQRDANASRQLEAAEQIAKWRYDDWARQNEADLRASNPFTIGRERIAYDPATGDANVLYRGRQDAEIYADSMGFDRGSEEWNAAAEDFVLRGSGPSAHSRDLELDDYRTANDRDLEGYRQSNRLEMERTRQLNRSAMEGARQSNRMTLRQTAPAKRSSSRPVATDGKGNKVEWNGSAWVPAK